MRKGNISTGWAIVLVLVILVGGYFLLQGNNQATPDDGMENATSTQQEGEVMDDSLANTEMSDNIVTYDGNAYSPNTITISQGESVTFMNESESQGMWTASALHPTHRTYPTDGGCLGSTFDACEETQPGESWTFTFDETGEWGYHNHVKPGDTGAVIVE